MKRYLRSKYRSLQQLYNRDHERNGRLIQKRRNLGENERILSGRHFNFPDNGDQYSSLQTKDCVFSTLKQDDSCFRSNEGSIFTISNIVDTPDGIFVDGHRFTVLDNFFTFPMNSMDLGIFRVSGMEARSRRWSINDVSKKCVLLPADNNSCLCVPLLHMKLIC